MNNAFPVVKNLLKIAVLIFSLMPFVAEQAARRCWLYHTDSSERIRPVAVCFDEVA